MSRLEPIKATQPPTTRRARTMTTKAERAADLDRARELLAELLAPGTTVYTVLRHVSRSGMLRHVDCYVITDSQPRWISWAVATVCGYRQADDGSIKVTGCGMDLGFSIVYNLSATLYRDGFDCISDPSSPRAPYDCPSNVHSNRNHVAHHDAGGYALKQAWL